MGVTIHYNGKLHPKSSRDEVIDVIRDFATSLEWKITDIDDKEHGILGLIAQPHPMSEPLNFIFTNDGCLINFFVYDYNKENNIDPVIDDLVKHCSCKTQFSSTAQHISIIKLLEFLNKQYFREMEIYDDGGYYPEGDTEELIHRFDKINYAIDILEDAINSKEFSIPITESENIENLVQEIENIFVKLRKNMK